MRPSCTTIDLILQHHPVLDVDDSSSADDDGCADGLGVRTADVRAEGDQDDAHEQDTTWSFVALLTDQMHGILLVFTVAVNSWCAGSRLNANVSENGFVKAFR